MTRTDLLEIINNGENSVEFKRDGGGVTSSYVSNYLLDYSFELAIRP